MTNEEEQAFLDVLAQGDSVTAAARAIGYSRNHVYERRALYANFAQRWDSAIEEGTDTLEDVATTRARDKSDLLMIFMLKGRRPAKFRDNSSISLSGSISLEALVTAIAKDRIAAATEPKTIEGTAEPAPTQDDTK